MKSFIIFALLAGLGAAAFFTRPSQADFQKFLVTKATNDDHNIFSKGWDEMRAKGFANSCTYNDRYLWVNVQKNGNTLYTGAFGHFFDTGAVADEVKKYSPH